MTKTIKRFIKNESGATAIEYALIAGIMSIALIAAFTLLGPQMKTSFDKIANTMNSGV